MELYGAGFNAHNQLSLKESSQNDSEDLIGFQKIACGEQIRVLFAGWSSTVLLIDSCIFFLGFGFDPNQNSLRLPIPNLEAPAQLKSFFGDLNGPIGATTASGHVLLLDLGTDGPRLFSPTKNKTSLISHVAIASTGRTAVVFRSSPTTIQSTVLEFLDVEALRSWLCSKSDTMASEEVHHKTYRVPGAARDLLAGANCFAVLNQAGEVYTWGDLRHPKSLGRTPANDSPAQEPGLVETLAGMPIVKICGNGWLFGALSRDRDLYLWGTARPSGELPHVLALGGGSDDREVRLVDFEKAENVSDFGIGIGHVVMLVDDGKVYGAGENLSSQLGIGNTEDVVDSWTLLRFQPYTPVARVACGAESTFLIVNI